MVEPLITSTLKKGEQLRERYIFGGGYSDIDDKKYVKFIETIMNQGFPKGHYIINGSAQFSISHPADAKIKETFNMNVKIGFTVNEDIHK